MTGTSGSQHNNRADTPIPGSLYSPLPSPLPPEAHTTQDTEGIHIRRKTDLPPWDRAVDVVCHRHEHEHHHQQTTLAAFTQSMKAYSRNEQTPATSGKQKGRSSSGSHCLSYAGLPDHIRLRICHYLTEDQEDGHHARVVTLSLPVFLREAWPPGTFTLITTALHPHQPYLGVSRSLRADILVSFLSSHTFHVIFSPYVNTRLSPFATLWLFRYGIYMRSIILKVDMSKLGNGPVAGLLSMTSQLERLVRMFAETQARREGRPIKELILLCRRFYGVRVATQVGDKTMLAPRKGDSLDGCSSPNSTSASPTVSDEIQHVVDQHSPCFYCPDYRLRLCDPLFGLRGQVSSLRMCGFGDQYTRQFVAKMFPDATHRFAYRLAPSVGPWGRLAGQKRFIDDGKGNIICDEVPAHDEPDSAAVLCTRYQGPVMPPPPIVNPDTKSVSLPVLQDQPRNTSTRPAKMAPTIMDSSSQVARKSPLATAGDISASEKKRRFLKLLAQCLVNREKRRLFST